MKKETYFQLPPKKFFMLDEYGESTTISLLTDSSQEDGLLLSSVSSPRDTRNARILRAQFSAVSASSSTFTRSPRKSCAHRTLEFTLNLPLKEITGHVISDENLILLSKLKSICEGYHHASRVLGTLLSRQWPKWHCVDHSELDSPMVDELFDLGLILQTSDISDWGALIQFPVLPTDHVLGTGLKIHKSATMLELFLTSLPIEHLKKLVHIPAKQTLSRPALMEKVKAAYNGKQRTIFGGLNDTQLLLSKAKDLDKQGVRLMLSETCKTLFTTLSFMLDLDSSDEQSWDSALPCTVIKTMVDRGITSMSPRRLTDRSRMTFGDPAKLRIFRSLDQINSSRFLEFLDTKIENKRMCPKTVCANVRSFLTTLDISWDPNSESPEWWWRRQLPRRCSNLIWKCIAELERMKFYDVAFDNLKYLIDNNKTLLGRKRRGKVAIRLIIECGHLGIDPNEYKDQLLGLDLYPADVAEITRKLTGLSFKKFDWACGPVKERTVEVFGAASRDFNWVENAALEEYYLNPQFGGFEKGIHCEGRAMMDIFNVLFRDVLGPPQGRPELFQSPLQRWALDIGFLERDPDRCAQALAVVDELIMYDFNELSEHFSSKNQLSSNYPLCEIISCMRGSTLSGIMKLMISDPYYWGGGQPDLLAWDTRTKRIVFSEVKGPGDHLSPRQRWWLMHLEKFGAEAEVCYVVDERNVKKRKRSLKAEEKTITKVEFIELD